MTTHQRSTEDRDPADQLAAEIADALQAHAARHASVPGTVTWTRAQLREQIRQAGAALIPDATPAHGQMPEPDRAPLIDKGAEP